MGDKVSDTMLAAVFVLRVAGFFLVHDSPAFRVDGGVYLLVGIHAKHTQIITSVLLLKVIRSHPSIRVENGSKGSLS